MQINATRKKCNLYFQKQFSEQPIYKNLNGQKSSQIQFSKQKTIFLIINISYCVTLLPHMTIISGLDEIKFKKKI